MNQKDCFYGTLIQNIIVPTTRSTTGVLASAAFDVRDVTAVAAFLNVYSWTSGTVVVQDVQFADDSSFTTNVTTFDASDIDLLLKNDRDSTVDALTQTSLSATGTRKISFPSHLAVGGQRYGRIRVIFSGTVSLSVQLQVILDYSGKPQVQS